MTYELVQLQHIIVYLEQLYVRIVWRRPSTRATSNVHSMIENCNHLLLIQCRFVSDIERGVAS